jgi:hypothetical protein
LVNVIILSFIYRNSILVLGLCAAGYSHVKYTPISSSKLAIP